MPTVVLTEKAGGDLDAIHEHYQEVLRIDAAFEVISIFLKTFRQLEQFPGSGRPSATPDVRELIISRNPFIASYRLKHGRIQILRVLHQRAERSQDW